MIEADVYNGVLALAIGGLLAVTLKRSAPTNASRTLRLSELAFDFLTVLYSVIVAIQTLAALVRYSNAPVGADFLELLLLHALGLVCLLVITFTLHFGHQFLVTLTPVHPGSRFITAAVIALAATMAAAVWAIMRTALLEAIATVPGA